MPDYVGKAGDTRIDFAFTLSDENGAFNLTGHTVAFSMRNEATKAAVVTNAACTVVSAVAGTGFYPWAAQDVANPGNFQGEIIVTRTSDGAKARWPRSSSKLFYDIQLMPSL